MAEPLVLVVGAGLAGLSAAVALAQSRFRVLVVEQSAAPGGAIHRQPLAGVTARFGLPAHHRRWETLIEAVRHAGDRIEIATGTRFAGLDRTGMALLTGTCNRFVAPAGLILATGASERVRPRPGWTLPGVVTAGAIQIQLKSSGEPPAGRIVLAGSGPLLIAAGAQLAAAGNPPVAIVEEGQPFRKPLIAMRLPLGYLGEASALMVRLLAARVPILTGGEVAGIEQHAGNLIVRISRNGQARTIEADWVGLHDGIRAGVPAAFSAAIPVELAGDAREALGARAAGEDGRLAARRLVATIAKAPADPNGSNALDRQRHAQALLRQIYAHDGDSGIRQLPDATLVCRCENRTAGHLRALGPSPTDRDLRLRGRIAMGRCQGRFCAEWARRIAGTADPATPLGAHRLPAHPLSIADLLEAGAAGLPGPGEHG